jgi:hypothetical protein
MKPFFLEYEDPDAALERHFDEMDHRYEQRRDDEMLARIERRSQLVSTLNPNLPKTMSMMKRYLLLIVTACAPENGFAQDAIESAILSGLVQLTYDPQRDVLAVMGKYDVIIEAYRTESGQVVEDQAEAA